MAGNRSEMVDLAPTCDRTAIPSPRARALFDWWASLLAGRAMPVRGDFLAEDLAAWWPDLIFYDAVPAGDASRFRFRVHGGNAVTSDGGNFTGKFLDEVMPAHLTMPILGCYRAVERRRLPLYSQGHWRSAQGYDVGFERLILPFGAERLEHALALLVRHEAPRPGQEGGGLASPTPFINDMLAFVAP